MSEWSPPDSVLHITAAAATHSIALLDLASELAAEAVFWKIPLLAYCATDSRPCSTSDLNNKVAAQLRSPGDATQPDVRRIAIFYGLEKFPREGPSHATDYKTFVESILALASSGFVKALFISQRSDEWLGSALTAREWDNKMFYQGGISDVALMQRLFDLLRTRRCLESTRTPSEPQASSVVLPASSALTTPKQAITIVPGEPVRLVFCDKRIEEFGSRYVCQDPD
jgi:hypothetical protein